MGPQASTAIPRKPLFPGGPAVSRLCLGTMMFGDQTDEREAARILDAYIEACMHFGIGAVAYSPLARGVLTGKYRDGIVPEGSRAARNETRIMETEFREETIAAANRAADHAVATGRDPVGLAIQWVLANEAVLSALCASGHTPVAGHSDPRYPFRGRATSFAGEGAPA